MSQDIIGVETMSTDKMAFLAVVIVSLLLLLVVIEKVVINPIQNTGGDFNALSLEIQGIREDNNRLVAAVTNLSFLNNCIIDANTIRTINIPLDNEGTFRRVSIIQLICPPIQGVG